MKKIVRLTESDLVRLVKRVINEQPLGIITPPKKDMVKTGTVKDLTVGDKFLVKSEEFGGSNIYGKIMKVTDLGKNVREFAVRGVKMSMADLNSSASSMGEKTYYFNLDTNSKLTSFEFNRKPVTTVKVPKFLNYMNVKPEGFKSNKSLDDPHNYYENTTNSYYMEQ